MAAAAEAATAATAARRRGPVRRVVGALARVVLTAGLGAGAVTLAQHTNGAMGQQDGIADDDGRCSCRVATQLPHELARCNTSIIRLVQVVDRSTMAGRSAGSSSSVLD